MKESSSSHKNPLLLIVVIVFIVATKWKYAKADVIDVKEEEDVLQQQHKYHNNYLHGRSSSVDANEDRIKRADNGELEDLCEADCRCIPKNNITILVECDFTKLYRPKSTFKLGRHNYVNSKTTYIHIKLAPDMEMVTQEGFFKNNKINRIAIEGGSQVEFGTNTLVGNYGPYPEIDVTNCHRVVIRDRAFVGEYKINVINAEDVIMMEHAFFNTTFVGIFSNITDLRPNQKAFTKAKGTLTVNGSKIGEFSPTEASFNEIRFNDCDIGSVKQGAFDIISTKSIVFEHCKIGTIEKGAFTEKLFCNFLSLTNCNIETIENGAISGSGIQTVIIDSNEIKTFEENAILVSAITALISNNKIFEMGHNWMDLKEYGNVTIIKNSFGNYNNIVIGPTNAHVHSCIFAYNSITKVKPNTFDMNKQCELREIIFNETCACKYPWLGKATTNMLSQSFCTVGDTLKYCFNSSLLNVAKYEEFCNPKSSQLDCMKNTVKSPLTPPPFITFPNDEEANQMLIWVLVISFSALCLLIIICVICCRMWRSKSSASSMAELSSTQLDTTNCSNQHTFSDGDRAIIAQTLKQMREKYPREVYDQVYNNTKKLTDGNLGELEIVRTIGEIVKTLDECHNPGDDFVAFTDILYKHLAPKNNNQQDPIYAIPDLTNAESSSSSNETETGMTNLDHIYAEPHSVQQPLLTNEYSSPLDRDEMGGGNLYSEPIDIHGENKLITPYAVVGSGALQSSMSQHPSTSKNNLPDVLSQSTSKVQRLAENLANDPTFHHQLPQYTIPNKRSKFAQPSMAVAGPSTSAQAQDRRQFGSESSNSNSEHSGGSNVTLEMDDVIDYVDA